MGSGCGDGAQTELFGLQSYTRADVKHDAVDMCSEQRAHRSDWAFHHLKDTHEYKGTCDLVLSLDVVHHLIGDGEYEAYMAQLFDHARTHILIHAVDHDKSATAPHSRHRPHSAWIAANRPGWHFAKVYGSPVAGVGPDQTPAYFAHYRRGAP